MTPRVSVIIPTYNNADTIDVALRSILDQTLRDIEIIVVDDASTDGTLQAARAAAAGDARVRFITAPDDPHRFDKRLNRNINAGWSARNAGLAVARGEYITFQDGDDASLLNRLEIQLGLIEQYNATHITTQCVRFDHMLVGTMYEGPLPAPTMGPQEIYALSQRSKGVVAKLSPWLNTNVPFRIKRLRVVNKLFFGTLDIYPGAGNSPLLKREVLGRVQFRPLSARVWPSFMGRGADRDFNFAIAEAFKDSYFFDIPLYLWRK
ncbi:MAG: glycosyltransferase family 2 protein [Patescibacteria group bacterium]|nr:glycosyltransferase family 2 protein [Patescibacteria group bacterium]